MSYTNLLFHVVFSTKGRRPLLTGKLLTDCHTYLGGVVRGLKGISIEIGGVADHVHLFVRLPPTIAVASLRAGRQSQFFEEDPRGD